MTVDKIPQTPEKDTSNWLKAEMNMGHLLKAFVTIIIACGAAWVTVKSDIETLKVRVSQIENKENEFREETKDFRQEQKQQFKDIQKTLTEIKLSLKDKKDRDD